MEKGGEDAFFASPVEAGNAPMFLGAVGVADGVGGWSEDGVDPAAYARTLMENCELAASPPAMLSPQEVRPSLPTSLYLALAICCLVCSVHITN